MLYDPKWEVKADPFTLPSLIAWLEKQPSGKGYAYACNGECLLARYFTDCGFQNVRMYCHDFRHGGAKRLVPLPADFNDIAIGRIGRFGRNTQHTYGAALARARAIEQ